MAEQGMKWACVPLAVQSLPSPGPLEWPQFT